eukprot:m.161676 g.161676  ORF g.161676 m.161676 type:complete len:62 (-) comp53043_c0_seq5:39-224(-)
MQAHQAPSVSAALEDLPSIGPANKEVSADRSSNSNSNHTKALAFKGLRSSRMQPSELGLAF